MYMCFILFKEKKKKTLSTPYFEFFENGTKYENCWDCCIFLVKKCLNNVQVIILHEFKTKIMIKKHLIKFTEKKNIPKLDY